MVQNELILACHGSVVAVFLVYGALAGLAEQAKTTKS